MVWCLSVSELKRQQNRSAILFCSDSSVGESVAGIAGRKQVMAGMFSGRRLLAVLAQLSEVLLRSGALPCRNPLKTRTFHFPYARLLGHLAGLDALRLLTRDSA